MEPALWVRVSTLLGLRMLEVAHREKLGSQQRLLGSHAHFLPAPYSHPRRTREVDTAQQVPAPRLAARRRPGG